MVGVGWIRVAEGGGGGGMGGDEMVVGGFGQGVAERRC